jgi:hypothetical protein
MFEIAAAYERQRARKGGSEKRGREPFSKYGRA